MEEQAYREILGKVITTGGQRNRDSVLRNWFSFDFILINLNVMLG